MNGALNIRYLTRSQIDTVKWDHCINTAENSLLYAGSFYLDQMADNWDALVLDDYGAVMPLPWKKKYGIFYLTQPFLAAQLGVFGKNIDARLLEQFLMAIPNRFRYWDIYLNYGNLFPLSNFKLYERSNYVLDLHRSYTVLSDGYRDNIRRNIKKARQAGCIAQKDLDVEKVIVLALRQMHVHTAQSEEQTIRFRKLYQQLHNQQNAITYGILSPNDQLIASAVFFFSRKRAYYILVGNHPAGKATGASHMLIDAFINDNAGKDMLLDFEGSDIPNLALFYSGFGATEEKYAAIKLNRLPFLLRWLKK